MVVLKSEIELKRVATPDDVHLMNGSVYLWVIHADKIPPHIGISTGNQFYSLKANGKDEKIPLDRILRILMKKRIATLFYEVSPKAVKVESAQVFASYAKTVTGNITCLQPIKDIFGNTSALKVVELLTFLEEQEVLMSCSGWQLPNSFESIPDYSSEDIHDRLKYLNHE